jgi:hypothetical protein
MKKWITIFFAVTLISGCSTIPSTPKPQSEKYTFQVIRVEIPVGDLPACHHDAEKIIKHPNAEISEYPIVIAGLGESVTNDQTKSVSMAEDYTVIDGKAVAKERIVQLGDSVSVTVDKIEDGAISYHLDANHKELIGFDEYKIENGLNLKIPFFEKRAVDTDLTQQPNSWLSLGGLVYERSNGEKKSLMICVKIIPPTPNK